MPAPTDDRGEPCSVAGLSARQVGFRSLNAQDLIGDDISAREYRVTSGLEDSISIVAGFAGWIVWQFTVNPLLKPHLPMWARVVLMVAAAFAAGLLAWWATLGWVRRRRFERISGIYLDAGRCASCGYPIAGLGPAPDGRIVCPECSAAWDAARVPSPDG